MTSYLDLCKLFIKSLQINKFNRRGGKFFFYFLIFITILFVFVPFILIFTIFIYEMLLKLDAVGYASYGFEALFYIMFIFLFIFSFNVLINELYYSEDIDHILPLPVKPEVLFASKFTSCFIVENIILYIILLFAIMAYVFALSLPITHTLLGIIGIIFLPIIPMVYVSLILLIVINILKKIANRKLLKRIEYIFIGLLILGITFLLLKMSTINFEAYVEDFANGNHLFLDIMKYIFPSVPFFVGGLEKCSVIKMFISILINIIYFIGLVFLSHFLYYDGVTAIATHDTSSRKSSLNRMNDYKVRKPLVEYFIKDLKILFRSPTFFINCILINIIWPIFVFIIIKIGLPTYTISSMRNLISIKDSNFYMIILLFVIGISIIVPAINSIASSAFSREGKNYYFIKYIPMKYGLQWREKYLLSFIISFIGIELFSIPFFIIISTPIINILFYIVISILCISFVSLTGILIDSAYPKTIWDDEADSLRENYNSFVAMGFSLLLFGILCLGGYYLYDHLLINLNLFILYSFIILVFINLILYYVCNKKISYYIISQENV